MQDSHIDKAKSKILQFNLARFIHIKTTKNTKFV